MDRKVIQNVLRQQFVYLWSIIVLDRNEKSLDLRRCDGTELTSNITERTRYLTKSDWSYNEQYMYNTHPNSSRAVKNQRPRPSVYLFITALDAASVGPPHRRAEVAEVACQQPRLSTPIVTGASSIFTKSTQIQKCITRYSICNIWLIFSSQDMEGHGALKMGERRQQEKRSTRRREGTTVLWPCKT